MSTAVPHFWILADDDDVTRLTRVLRRGGCAAPVHRCGAVSQGADDQERLPSPPVEATETLPDVILANAAIPDDRLDAWMMWSARDAPDACWLVWGSDADTLPWRLRGVRASPDDDAALLAHALAAAADATARRAARGAQSLAARADAAVAVALAGALNPVAVTLDGAHVHANEPYLRLFDLSPVDLPAFGVVDLVATEPADAIKSWLRAARADAPPSPCAVILTRGPASGSSWLLLAHTAVVDEEACVQISLMPADTAASHITHGVSIPVSDPVILPEEAGATDRDDPPPSAGDDAPLSPRAAQAGTPPSPPSGDHSLPSALSVADDLVSPTTIASWMARSHADFDTGGDVLLIQAPARLPGDHPWDHAGRWSDAWALEQMGHWTARGGDAVVFAPGRVAVRWTGGDDRPWALWKNEDDARTVVVSDRLQLCMPATWHLLRRPAGMGGWMDRWSRAWGIEDGGLHQDDPSETDRAAVHDLAAWRQRALTAHADPSLVRLWERRFTPLASSDATWTEILASCSTDPHDPSLSPDVFRRAGVAAEWGEAVFHRLATALAETPVSWSAWLRWPTEAWERGGVLVSTWAATHPQAARKLVLTMPTEWVRQSLHRAGAQADALRMHGVLVGLHDWGLSADAAALARAVHADVLALDAGLIDRDVDIGRLAPEVAGAVLLMPTAFPFSLTATLFSAGVAQAQGPSPREILPFDPRHDPRMDL